MGYEIRCEGDFW